MNKQGITAENMLRTLPTVLRNDSKMLSLATAISSTIEKIASAPTLAMIYNRIDQLEEPVLDTLAKDFKVDWWRPDSSLEEKRRALKNSWYIHKHLGTKAAIEKAVSDYLGTGKVEEWFEYGGKPHHFRISSENNAEIVAQYDAFLAILNVVKRCSSVLDHITASLHMEQTLIVGFALATAKRGAIESDSVDVEDLAVLTDPSGIPLTDGFGNILIL